MQLTKFSKHKIIHTPGKNCSLADLLSRSFTKEELQIYQLKHKNLPPQYDFTLLQNSTLKPVHYLIKHEEVYRIKSMTLIQSNSKHLSYQKHNESLQQQSLLLNDTDVTSDDEGHIYTRIAKNNSPLSIDETLHEQEEPFSTIKKSTTHKTPKPLSESTSAIDVQIIQLLKHTLL